MSLDILKDVTVRVISSDGVKQSVGSGIFVYDGALKYYVITAEHCVFGKINSRLSDIDHRNIKVEYKRQNSDEFQEVIVNEIVVSNEQLDITVLSVEVLKDHAKNILFSTINSESDCSELAFRGYPKWLSETNEAKTFNCKIEENDNDHFIIKSEEVKDPSFMRAISETSSGLSGSGVFDFKNGRAFLVGIVTDLRDSKGTFGHIRCAKLDSVYSLLRIETHPLSVSAQELLVYSDEIDMNSIKKQIEILRNANNDRFENLDRKCRVLYRVDDVERMINELLIEFFRADIELKKIGKLNGFIQEDFDKVQGALSKRVKTTFNNRQVQNMGEAQDIFNEVRNLFYQFMKDTNQSDLSTNIIESIGGKAVNELLLNCDLNFIKE